MKFSQRKKAKIRKNNQRQINRYCKDMIGCLIDFEHGYTVKDQAKIKDIIYLLAQSEDNQYAIYKIVKVRKYVRLSPKKILLNQKFFSTHRYWHNDSVIQITPEGEIESVKRAQQIITMKNNKPTLTWVIR